jgi:hypothetical protein
VIQLILVWKIAKDNADLKKQLNAFKKMMRDAGIKVAAEKSREEQSRLDGLQKKGPVGGGAGGRSSKVKTIKETNNGNGGSASEGEHVSDSEASMLGPNEDEEEPEEDLQVDIKEMIWTSYKRNNAFFIGRYLSQAANVRDRFEVKHTLVDWPETALKFVYFQYGHDRNTVEYIEKQCRGMFEFPNSKLKGKVVPGFVNLKEYARSHGWALMEDKWKKRFTAKGTPILQRLNFPNVDVSQPEGKKGTKGKTKKAVVLSKKSKKNDQDDSSMESVRAEPNIVAAPVEDPVRLEKNGIVSDVTKTSSPELQDLDENNVGLDTPVVVEDSGLYVGVEHAVVQAENIAEKVTPMKGKKRQFFELKDNNAVCEACKPGVNHQWHEFTTGSYVTTGFLSGGERCGGEIDGSECGKLFVAKASALKGNESQLEFQPTLKRPAFGCTICGIGMCFECKNYYEENIRMSPGRKGRVGRIGNKN